jgi:hypothetical protein
MWHIEEQNGLMSPNYFTQDLTVFTLFSYLHYLLYILHSNTVR